MPDNANKNGSVSFRISFFPFGLMKAVPIICLMKDVTWSYIYSAVLTKSRQTTGIFLKKLHMKMLDEIIVSGK